MRDLRHSPAHRAVFVAILIAALVCSHWQGLAHRINHAARMLGVPPAALALQADAGDVSNSEQAVAHACLALDAASVAVFLATTPFKLDVRRDAPVMAAWIAFISYLAPCTPHFSSRAPPST